MRCSVSGCGSDVGPKGAKGMCPKHYKRSRRGADPAFDLRAPAEIRFRRHVTPGAPDQCWEWQGGRDRDGYGVFFFDGKSGKATRFAWLLKTGGLPDPALHVCHRCDNPPCVNPDHLFVGTTADNNADRAAKGRSRGNPLGIPERVKLTAEQVEVIRREGNPYPGRRRELAEQFGVSQQHIRAVQLGQRR